MLMPPHLEFFDLDTLQNCVWSTPYKDYDGTWAEAPCTKPAEVMLVCNDAEWWPEENEVMGHPFCRPHGNLALIEERQGWEESVPALTKDGYLS